MARLALALISINQHTKFEVPNFTHSKDIIGPKNFEMDHVTLTAPI